MVHEQGARGHHRRLHPSCRLDQRGVTSSEYLVIAGVVVAIVLAVASVFRTEIMNGITILGCQIGIGASGGSGSCGGGTATAGGTAPGGGAPGGTGPGGRLGPGQLVPVGPLPAGGGAPGAGGVPGGRAPGGGAPGVDPASLAGNGPMAPGGPTVSPDFGTASAVAGAIGRAGGPVAGEGLDTLAAAVPNPLPGGSPGLPVKDTINATTARYGNWVGAGWSGASESPDKVGAMPPVDPMDALGQAHDFGYAIADEAERLYGPAEGNRLRALADEIGYRAWQRLDPDPNKWVPKPPDIDKARDYYNRFAAVMQTMGSLHDRQMRGAPPPTPAQLAALRARGPINAAQLAAEERRRVQAWNRDRGVDMRSRNSWK